MVKQVSTLESSILSCHYKEVEATPPIGEVFADTISNNFHYHFDAEENAEKYISPIQNNLQRGAVLTRVHSTDSLIGADGLCPESFIIFFSYSQCDWKNDSLI